VCTTLMSLLLRLDLRDFFDMGIGLPVVVDGG
jgi:hypothetical protein